MTVVEPTLQVGRRHTRTVVELDQKDREENLAIGM
jgi:hypothetical protein